MFLDGQSANPEDKKQIESRSEAKVSAKSGSKQKYLSNKKYEPMTHRQLM